MTSYLFSTNGDWVVSVVRIILGIVLFAHGAQKMLGWFNGHGLSATMRIFAEQMKFPAPVAFLVISAEFFGGLGLLVGLLSRVAAIGVVAIMLGAIVMVHFKFGFFLNWFGEKSGHGFEYHLLAIALALVIVIEGSGPWSLDQLYDRHYLQAAPVSQADR